MVIYTIKISQSDIDQLRNLKNIQQDRRVENHWEPALEELAAVAGITLRKARELFQVAETLDKYHAERIGCEIAKQLAPTKTKEEN